ncbi:MAG: hypothetical protein PHP62_03650 [Candidatus Moranbacteria bacterium]|nr:hypothetical protein [Candidatus Moranbacteria bacterium]
MSIEKLIAAAKKTVKTKDDIKQRKKRLAKSEQRFIEEDKQKRVDQSFLNKEYTL